MLLVANQVLAQTVMVSAAQDRLQTAATTGADDESKKIPLLWSLGPMRVLPLLCLPVALAAAALTGAVAAAL